MTSGAAWTPGDTVTFHLRPSDFDGDGAYDWDQAGGADAIRAACARRGPRPSTAERDRDGPARLHLGACVLTSATLLPTGAAQAELSLRNALYRPQYHFTPPRGWMNDPNGLVFFEGLYHLFYQHYPGGYTAVPGGRYADPLRWGPMHWGHAVSRDLVRWEHLPIALAPDTPPTPAEPIIGTIYSGSAVVDRNNTAGFQTGPKPALVALFTQSDLVTPPHPNQRQSLAYSNDGGLTWTKYGGNPVLPNPGVRDFRDPKVSWHEPTERWVMVLAVQDRIAIYSSTDLKAWTKESDFGPGQGSQGRPWECPDLFPLPVDGAPEDTRWVLLVSQGKGALHGGSGTQYFVGRFDGRIFTNENPPETVLWVDHGRDNYAGITWCDHPRSDWERLFIGWMSNWDYARNVPAETFRSAMTLPRLLTLRSTGEGVRLSSLPVPGVTSLRRATLSEHGRVVLHPGDDLLKGVEAECCEIVAEIAPYEARRFGFHLRMSANGEERTTVAYDVAAGRLSVDRTLSGEFPFNDKGRAHVAPLAVAKGHIELRIFVDRTSVEVFAGDGQAAITDIIFPARTSRGLSLWAEGGAAEVKKLRVHEMGSLYDG